MKSVVIIGGGIAGLSAAHELAERGLRVSVYERHAVPGGKARSIWVKGVPIDWDGADDEPHEHTLMGRSGTRDPRDLPGEHGFRFFPRFYRHLPDTLRRIPYPGNADGVLGNLLEASRMLTAAAGFAPFAMPARFPRSLDDLRSLVTGSIAMASEFRPEDAEFLMERMWQVATSCEERKLAEYEKICWWDFIDAGTRPQFYQDFASLIRVTVAADPHRADARTEGNMALQMFFAMSEPGVSNDRLLNGPTNEVWIDPWVRHLRNLGVDFHMEARATAIVCEGGRIARVTIHDKDGHHDVTGDYYLFCVPVEQMRKLLLHDVVEKGGTTHYRNVLAADPALAGILELGRNVDWMNGIQFYLKDDIEVVNGHAAYLGTPWALSSISQHQFWRDFDWSKHGDGTVRGILSVDISDWETPGIVGHGKNRDQYKPARDCTVDEIAEDVWAQLKGCLNAEGREVLRDEDLHSYNVDADIHYWRGPVRVAQAQERAGAHDTNAEPLLINMVDTWRLRPEASTAIPNLFLAADYLRTNTELATMEAANEAARRAVNAILKAAGSTAPQCSIWPLHAPAILGIWKWYDRWRFRRGLPWRAHLPLLLRAAQWLMFAVVDLRRALGGAAGSRAGARG